MSENTNETNMTVKTATIIRTVCLALALINQLLTASGHSALPIADEEVATIISTVITVAVAVWNWWKNNSFTKPAIAADAYMDELKKAEK